MIYEVYSNINRLAIPSFQNSASKFQGRIYHSLTQEINGDRMIELAKVIGTVAFIALSASIVAGGIYLFISKVISKQKNQPLKYKPKIIEENLNVPANPANPENNKIAVQQPKRITPYQLPALDETLPLVLVSDDQKSNLKKNLTETADLLIDLPNLINPPTYLVMGSIDRNFLDKMNQLGPFQRDAQVYEDLATTLKNMLQSHLDNPVFPKHSCLGGSYKIDNLYYECKKNISLVFAAICERYFNQSDFEKCCQLAQRCISDRELRKGIFRALIIRQINLGHLDEAYNLYIAAENKELAELLLYIAKMYFNQGNLDKALKLAPQLVVNVDS